MTALPPFHFYRDIHPKTPSTVKGVAYIYSFEKGAGDLEDAWIYTNRYILFVQ